MKKTNVITRKTPLGQVLRSPAGHDIIARLFYSLGLSEDLIAKTWLGRLSVGSLTALSGGRLDDSFIDALLKLFNTDNGPQEHYLGEAAPHWWKEAVFYQIYPRSFMDSDNDGIGDLNGIISRLDYLQSLGINAVWCGPIFDSPNDDNGYDIRDYRAVMREYGTLADFERLISELHRRGMRFIMDLVLNHTSDEHRWFQESLRDPQSQYGSYYLWRDGSPEQLPNNWDSMFSGPAWKYFPERKAWAMHIFTAKQMDLNWDNPQVRKEIQDLTNWWLAKGVDGFRFDVISFISKEPGLPDGNPVLGDLMGFHGVEHYFHGPHLDEYLRELRQATFGNYDSFTVGECPGAGLMLSQLLCSDRRGELDAVFSFDHTENPGKKRFDIYRFDLRPMAEELIRWQTGLGNDCWPTVFFENHDMPRITSKACPDGRRQELLSKLLATLQMTLRGSPFIYQGEELGMTNYPFTDISQFRDVESLNKYRELRDKGYSARRSFARVLSGSRDHARTPMQWTAGKNAGFTAGAPWLPVNPNHDRINAESEAADPGSVLNYYRQLISLRHQEPALVYGSFNLAAGPGKVLAYYRIRGNARFAVELNLTDRYQTHPKGWPAGRRIIGNYSGAEAILRPYEAIVSRVG